VRLFYCFFSALRPQEELQEKSDAGRITFKTLEAAHHAASSPTGPQKPNPASVDEHAGLISGYSWSSNLRHVVLEERNIHLKNLLLDFVEVTSNIVIA
jgi:hypothetical protein